jgi:hypothetical protein
MVFKESTKTIDRTKETTNHTDNKAATMLRFACQYARRLVSDKPLFPIEGKILSVTMTPWQALLSIVDR